MSGRPWFNLVIALIVIVAIFFGYRWFWGAGGDDSGAPGLEPAGLSAGTSDADSDEFVDLLYRLEPIVLKGDIFNNSVFKSLEDYTTPLRSQAPGRRNPFAPLGAGGGQAASSTSVGRPAVDDGAGAPPSAADNRRQLLETR